MNMHRERRTSKNTHVWRSTFITKRCCLNSLMNYVCWEHLCWEQMQNFYACLIKSTLRVVRVSKTRWHFGVWIERKKDDKTMKLYQQVRRWWRRLPRFWPKNGCASFFRAHLLGCFDPGSLVFTVECWRQSPDSGATIRILVSCWSFVWEARHGVNFCLMSLGGNSSSSSLIHLHKYIYATGRGSSFHKACKLPYVHQQNSLTIKCPGATNLFKLLRWTLTRIYRGLMMLFVQSVRQCAVTLDFTATDISIVFSLQVAMCKVQFFAFCQPKTDVPIDPMQFKWRIARFAGEMKGSSKLTSITSRAKFPCEPDNSRLSLTTSDWDSNSIQVSYKKFPIPHKQEQKI